MSDVMTLEASTLRWWSEMGVDTLVDEAPVPWLDRGKPATVRASSHPVADPAPVPSALPATLIGLQQWLANDPTIPLAPPPAQRLSHSGANGAALMILADMPLVGDLEAGELLSGEVGELYAKMLLAMNWSRVDTYIATLCPGRTPSGALDAEHLPRLGEIARHHIALAAPDQVWLLGDAVSCAVLGISMMDARGRLHKINHINGNTEAVVSYSPAFLHRSPRRKGDAWADMQLLTRGTGA